MNNSTVYISSSMPDLSFIKIRQGDWVVIKPNLVKESKETDADEWRSVITSPDLIKAVCDDVCQKLGPGGRVTICDAPQTDSSFAKLAETIGLYEIARESSEKYNIPVEVVDLRNEEWVNEGGIITERRALDGDPEGSVVFNLSTNSLFYGHKGEGRYYGADYDAGVVNSHHQGETQEYLICATPIKADVFINMPKLKTHKKTGVTLSLKNLVGINADKNWLPHHTEGAPHNGGDEYPDLSTKRRVEQKAVNLTRKIALKIPWLGPKLAKQMRKAGAAVFGDGQSVIRAGNWFGNDTTWRMVLDLNRCLLYGDSLGNFSRSERKRYYTLVDGLIGMEGMGPMQGDAVEVGLVIGGPDPVAVDAVCARVMGFDWRKIPVIDQAFRVSSYPITELKPEDIVIESDRRDWNGRLAEFDAKDLAAFRPHFGWSGHIEADEEG